MDTKMAPKAEGEENAAQPEIPVSNPQPGTGKPPSYSMMEPKMRRIYGEFYREIYFSEAKHLDTKTQELISIAASLIAKCQGCIEGHMKKAIAAGATREEISETISIACAINAAAVIDLTDVAAANMNVNLFPSEGPRFKA